MLSASLLTSVLLSADHLVLSRFLLWLAAFLLLLTAATVARIIASGFGHDGQLSRGGSYPCTQPCLPTPPSTNCCSRTIAILPIVHVKPDARAEECCIRPAIRANRVLGCITCAQSSVCVSVSVALSLAD